MASTIFDENLDKTRANYVPLSPLSFLARSAKVFPERTAVVYGETRRSWGETYARCRRLASALQGRGVGRGDTVAVMAANIPEMFEAHFGVPMAGAVLNTINIRLEAEDVTYILNHGEAKVVLVDPEFADVVKRAAAACDSDPLIVDILDAEAKGEGRAGEVSFDALLEEGDPDFDWKLPDDEWDAISLNYTSGTTGDPKGVVYHHRGAYLNALAHIPSWGMKRHSVYLWTLPMFHCNGWCFPWTIAAISGVSVSLRAVREKPIFDAIRKEKVTHFCGAPIVLNTIATADPSLREGIDHEVKAMTAGAAPPARVMQDMEAMGIAVTHVYGLTETYGPATICEWKEEWSDLDQDEKNALKVRQGVENHALEELTVLDAETMEPVPHDGETIGEVFFRGNNVMKGYLKMPDKTEEDFRGGYFASGDLAVMHPNGYIEIKDRAKDIIISGGENISTLEVEDVIYKHPAVNTAAVVARPDDKWGETPCAFVELKSGKEATEEEIISHCRERMARFKAPKTVIFGELPKTSTGKIQKFVLREKARNLDAEG
jgi:fatty-acyl-CoA synthase